MKRGDLLSNFIILATNAHAGQYDRAGQPYILHVLKVLQNVHELFGDLVDEELECIAVSHDLIEDTNTTIEDMIKIGGTQRVVNAILALTKKSNQSYDLYVQSVLSNEDAMRVKLADIKHNVDLTRLKKITEKDKERQHKYIKLYNEIEQTLNHLTQENHYVSKLCN